MNKSIIHIADELTDELVGELPELTLYWPENGRSGNQIQQYVKGLLKNPEEIFTNSLYLIREIEMNKLPVLWINHKKDGTTIHSEDVNALGGIEILDRELEQSDRYINKI
jgi:hypothetical protein